MGLGPLHYMVITFAGDRLTSEVMSELRTVRSRGLIRLVDLLFVTKSHQGVAQSIEVSDLRGPQVGELAAALRELLPGWAEDQILPIAPDGVVRAFTEEDVQVFAEAIPNASSAAIVLFEHTWARGLAEALDRSGGAISSEAILHGGRVFPTAL